MTSHCDAISFGGAPCLYASLFLIKNSRALGTEIQTYYTYEYLIKIKKSDHKSPSREHGMVKEKSHATVPLIPPSI
jgi:hypothetical protein